MPMAASLSLRALDGLDFEVHADLVAHDDAVARDVEGDAEVASVDGGAGREAGPGAAPRIARGAVELELERHGLGHAAQCELAIDDVSVALGAHGGRAEVHGRVRVDGKEVGAAEVGVPTRVAGVDGVELDGGGDAGRQRVVGDLDRAAEAGEGPADLRDHEVADGEGDLGVRGVDVPGAGGEINCVACCGGGGGHDGSSSRSSSMSNYIRSFD